MLVNIDNSRAVDMLLERLEHWTDDAYEDIKALYDAEGLTDISCEHGKNHGYSFIEAEYDGNFLCRY